MSNPSKQRGTRAETALVKWARANGFAGADRQPLRGSRDQGDAHLGPGVIVEVKSHRLPTGYPTRGQLDTWMNQTRDEALNADADLGILVVKRPGTQDVGRWFAHVETIDWLTLLGVPFEAWPGGIGRSLVMTPLADLAIILRHAGYGDPIEEDQ